MSNLLQNVLCYRLKGVIEDLTKERNKYQMKLDKNSVYQKYMEKVHIMLMENCMKLHEPEDLRFIFDLKGSRVDRKVNGCTKPTSTLKDENFRIINDMKQKK